MDRIGYAAYIVLVNLKYWNEKWGLSMGFDIEIWSCHGDGDVGLIRI